MLYEKKKCWSILFRLYHWAFALSIVCLVTTGFYIHEPWTNTMIEGSASWPMAWMRYIHFVAGYVFTAAVLVRLFLYIFGNSQERIWDALPVTKRNIRSLKDTILQYSYLSDSHEDRLGHNTLAGLTYVAIIFLAVFQFISGFYMLFPEVADWEAWGVKLFGNQQMARYIHHLLMWCFMLFAFIHVYLVIWNDIKEPEGLISSVFTGDKFKHKNT